MKVFHLIVMAAMSAGLAVVPAIVRAEPQSNAIAQAAKPTPSQVKAAVKTALASVDLTLPQKRAIKSMVQSYESQTANADDATKQAAQETLLKNIYQTLTPQQQTQFKASIKQSLGADIQ